MPRVLEVYGEKLAGDFPEAWCTCEACEDLDRDRDPHGIRCDSCDTKDTAHEGLTGVQRAGVTSRIPLM
jgi:hypothetical protein